LPKQRKKLIRFQQFKDFENCLELVSFGELSDSIDPKSILGNFFVERFGDGLVDMDSGQRGILKQVQSESVVDAFSLQRGIFRFAQDDSGLGLDRGCNSNSPKLILEVGCGKGEYVVDLATKYPENNYVGIDIKGDRMSVGAKLGLENNLHNAAFIRCQVENLDRILSPNSVDEIWITFADPQPNKPARRLTHSNFLNKYSKILKTGGKIHLKTDSIELFDFTKSELLSFQKILKINKQSSDLHNLQNLQNSFEIENTTTTFEKKYLEQKVSIKYLELEKI
jgi:tRNA (guanine-N7-)-methyltransferase